MALRDGARVARMRRWPWQLVAPLAGIGFAAALLAFWPMSGTADPVVPYGHRYTFGCPSLVGTVGSPPRGLVAFERTGPNGRQLPAADATARAASIYQDQCDRARESRIGLGIVAAIVAVIMLAMWAVWRAVRELIFEHD